MYVNTLITLQENAPTYGTEGKGLMGHITLRSPGYVMCYVQNLKKQKSDVVYGLYVFNKGKAKGLRVGELKEDRETRWLVNEKDINESGLRLDEIDGVAIVAEHFSRGTELVMSGFSEGRYMIIPIIDEITERLRTPKKPYKENKKVEPRHIAKVVPPDQVMSVSTLGPLKSHALKQPEVLEPGPVIPEGEMEPGPVIPEGEMEPGPVIPEGEMEPGPVIPEGEMEPGPVIPEGEMEPEPVIPEGEMEPEPVIPEGEMEPGPVIPEGEMEPGPVIPEGEMEPGPVIPEGEMEPGPVIPEGEMEPEPVIPEEEMEPEGDTFEEGMANKVKILEEETTDTVPTDTLEGVELIKVAEDLEEPEKDPAIIKQVKSGIPYGSTAIPNASVVRQNTDQEALKKIIGKLKQDERVCEKTKSIEEQIEKMQSATTSSPHLQKSDIEEKIERTYISKQEEEQEEEILEEEEERDSTPRHAHEYLAQEARSNVQTETVDYLAEIEKKIREITAKRNQKK